LDVVRIKSKNTSWLYDPGEEFVLRPTGDCLAGKPWMRSDWGCLVGKTWIESKGLYLPFWVVMWPWTTFCFFLDFGLSTGKWAFHSSWFFQHQIQRFSPTTTQWVLAPEYILANSAVCLGSWEAPEVWCSNHSLTWLRRIFVLH
jgi:hypothetical protein